MKKIALLVSVAAIAVIAASVLYYSFAKIAPQSHEAELSRVESSQDTASPARVEPGSAIEPATKDVPAVAGAAAARAAIETDPGLGLPPERRCTLAVRVTLPEGAPRDDEPEILVIGKLPEKTVLEVELAKLGPADPRPAWLLARRPLDPTGVTEVVLERGATRLGVGLHARYCFAKPVLDVDVSGERSDVTLAATLGACVFGRIVPPSDASEIERELAGAKVDLKSDPVASEGFGGPGSSDKRVSKSSACRADGSFEISGVPAAVELTLSGRPEHLAAFKSTLAPLTAGQRLELSIPLTRGALASGRVLDEGGSGISGAEISVRADAVMWGMGGRTLRETKSGPDGSFTLEAVAAGKVMVDASAEGYLESTTNLELAEGARLEDLVLRLEGGSRVAGTVVWADGTPAAAAEIKVRFDPAHLAGIGALNAMRGAEGDGKSDASGAFSIGGLGKGPFLVMANALPAGASEGANSSRWRAELGEVKPGTLDLRLALAAPGDVAGRVVDDVGAPVAECTVVIARSQRNPWIEGDEEQELAVANPEGSFSARELAAGDYTAKAKLAAGSSSEPVAFEVPRAKEAGELTITLMRPATVSGRVILPDGSPAAHARVHQQLSIFDMQRGRVPGSEPSCTSGEDGTFTSASMPIGAISLRATKDGYAPSEPVSVKLEPAGSVADVTLALRIGGTITGEVFGKDGKPKPGATILAQMPDLRHGQLWAKSDASGKFQYTNVAPGQWQVMLLAFDANSTSSPASGDEDPSGKAMADFLDQMKVAMASVKDGATVHVLLGAPAKDPVHVRGRVTADKAGVAGVMVSFISTDGGGEKGAALGSMKMKSSDQDGRFEIDLDHAGGYLVSVQRLEMTPGAQQSVEFSRVVPDGPECSLEFELPLGSIAGRVSNSDGDPLPRARISLNVDGPLQGGTLTGGRFSETHTDERGEFLLGWLAPGTYTVSAGGQSMADVMSDSIPMGRQMRDGIRVSEGERVGGIDFRLKTACDLSGRVLDGAGKPVAEASIFLRDEAGRAFERISMTNSDAGGRFRQRGLAAGRYSVSARSESQISGETQVVLRDGEPCEVDLRLDDGTMLVVTVVDKDEAPLQVSLSVTDEKGREVNGLYSLSDLMRAFTEGNLDAKKSRLGPLAPGKYQVTAIAPDGTRLSRSVTLIGQSERKITLKLEN